MNAPRWAVFPELGDYAETRAAHWIATAAEEGPGNRKMSAGPLAWHSPNYQTLAFWVLAAAKLVDDGAKILRAQWWVNVLFPGAAYAPHEHPGNFAFVLHLTGGARVEFENEAKLHQIFSPEPGGLIVFPSKWIHRTEPVNGPGARVSIAGNLWLDLGARNP